MSNDNQIEAFVKELTDIINKDFLVVCNSGDGIKADDVIGALSRARSIIERQQPCPEDKQIAEFVERIRSNLVTYSDFFDTLNAGKAIRKDLREAIDTIERQQNKCFACETYYEDTIKTQKAELERLKEAGNA